MRAYNVAHKTKSSLFVFKSAFNEGKATAISADLKGNNELLLNAYLFQSQFNYNIVEQKCY